MCKFASAIIFLAFSSVTIYAEPIQWTTQDGGNGHWYEVISTTPSMNSWESAKELAEARGGYLVTITSPQEQEFFADITGDERLLMGGYNGPDGWEWVTGEPWKYTNWSVNEPSGDGPYLVKDNLPHGPQWNDIHDSVSYYAGYVIEWNHQTSINDFEEIQKIQEGNGGDFGGSVDINGSMAIVGKRSNSSAYIYRFDGLDWYIDAHLTGGSEFGHAVAIENDWAIAAGYLQNRVSIYRFSGTEWYLHSEMVPGDSWGDGGIGNCGNRFGHSVDIENNTLVIGADGCNKVFVARYNEENDEWEEHQVLNGSDYFGQTVSISNEWIAVSVPNQSSCVTYKTDNLEDPWWEQHQTLFIGDNSGGSGDKVCIDNGLLVIGSWDNSCQAGTAYVFRINNDGTSWELEQHLQASNSACYDQFGRAVTVSNNTIIIGAQDDHHANNAGSIYVFRTDGLGNWFETQFIAASDYSANQDFSYSVALSGTMAVVGSPGNNAAYFFDSNAIEDEDGDSVDDSIDNCYLYNPGQEDCNENGIGDACDIYEQWSTDCDQNGEPDECQNDCDGDGLIDPCDTEPDLDQDGVPDNCESDCNDNTIPDDYEIELGLAEDCNENGIPDECDLVNSGQVPEDAVQWTIEEGGNGHWYLAVEVGESTTESSMIAFANGLGASLASISSLAEDAFVRSVASNATPNTALLGGYETSEGEFIWLDGTDFNYTNWDAGQPDGVNAGEYIAYYEISNFDKWHDVSFTDSTVSHFIIEFSETLTDCNSNGILDSCEIADNPSLDCNGNGALDSCEDFDDCNYNDIPDSCDISDGTSNDVNMNGVPDECESDCNENGIPDDWEIKKGLVFDCNENMLPDECDIADGTSNDVNSNDVPDECEDDCNGNGIPDDWDIKTGAALDCNGNGIPDYCDVAAGCDTDCNLNGVPDSCDLASGTSEDINANNLPDECECIADITDDGVVNIHDLLALIGYWGSPGPLGDFNADGIVKIHDLLILIAAWGECTNIICNDDPPIGAVQWPVEVGGNGHWYMAVSTGSDDINWEDAKVNAMLSGGSLVTFSDIDEFEFVKSNIANDISLWSISSGGHGDCLCNGPWIGASNQGAGIVQVDGTAWPFTDQTYPWHPGNPDNCCPSVVNFWDYYGSRSLGDHPSDTTDIPNSYIIEWSN